jgi:hypothetical protein
VIFSWSFDLARKSNSHTLIWENCFLSKRTRCFALTQLQTY